MSFILSIIEEALRYDQVQKVCLRSINVSSLTLLAVDCFMTLPSEVQYIWNEKWSFVKVLYLITRYLAFTDCLITIIFCFKRGLRPNICRQLLQSQTFLIYAGFLTAELIMVIRIRALYGRESRFMRVFLPTFSVVMCGALLASLYSQVKIIHFILDPIFHRCIPTKASNTQWIPITLLLGFEFVIITLTLIKAYTQGEASRRSLLKMLYRDSIIYFLFSFVSSLINVVTLMSAPIAAAVSIQRVLHSNLSARVILNLHEASFLEKKEQYSSMNFQLTSLHRYERGEEALGAKMGTREIQLA